MRRLLLGAVRVLLVRQQGAPARRLPAGHRDPDRRRGGNRGPRHGHPVRVGRGREHQPAADPEGDARGPRTRHPGPVRRTRPAGGDPDRPGVLPRSRRGRLRDDLGRLRGHLATPAGPHGPRCARGRLPADPRQPRRGGHHRPVHRDGPGPGRDAGRVRGVPSLPRRQRAADRHRRAGADGGGARQQTRGQPGGVRARPRRHGPPRGQPRAELPGRPGRPPPVRPRRPDTHRGTGPPGADLPHRQTGPYESLGIVAPRPERPSRARRRGPAPAHVGTHRAHVRRRPHGRPCHPRRPRPGAVLRTPRDDVEQRADGLLTARTDRGSRLLARLADAAAGTVDPERSASPAPSARSSS